MKVDVTEYEKVYTFQLEKVTQLCGQNIIKKTYIFDSLRKYFSTFKYSEEKNKWRDDVKINNEMVGRKFFTLLSFNGISEMLTMIKLSKQSLMTEYIKKLMQKFNYQTHLNTIYDELEKIFQMLNIEINNIGEVELTFAESDLWEMVQKSEIIGSQEILLEDKDNYEVIIILLNLIEEVIKNNPRKILVILENIDHLIWRKEYADIITRLQEMGNRYDIYFILSTSIEGYVSCSDLLCQGISIFGDIDFQMPEFEKVAEFISDNYPYNKEINVEQMQNDLNKIIHRIGQKNFLYSIEENIICKLINQSMMIEEKWDDVETISEINYLKA